MAFNKKGVAGRQLSRRSMVQGTALGLIFAFSGGAARSVTIAGGYRPRYFNDAEWSTLAAFVERLIPPDSEGPSALEAHVPEFIDRQMMTPYGFGDLWYLHGPFVPDAPAVAGYQHAYSPREIYRLGFKALNDAVFKRFNKHFSELKSDAQDSILKDMEHGAIELTPVPSKLLFSQILKNCKEGYFSDPIHGGNADMAAWKMIGFPGARAEFTDFVNLNGAPYPLGPVSILGSAAHMKNGKN
ncbi:gluconate 2-dehydrogenase subunit 3 family protein [Gluconobacter kondonii]|uniref:gluconate 2-dehydrogenase subunit 3 family protein n=1 Tax=Gluconobacter kondonii TaxID=941463 RepID=UPI00198101B8|nr:gluconate 2-dehydrogenase subunit 3 family protein [Gluconobacter kondonii]MBN3868305.1 gluconate 2-dehydrogenase subunit 3 family protein [Gluconobacter kondonii]MBS1054610.1 gluconate 2-dehydrogenase subunit 3 family protein [Gluconobacter kondonii]MBS1057854.1 gluconate 2-dehydrogenase subunit 3 family protein [Gluconobacter kondonii]MBS1078675.1 gluconate 2-dehydrogenase subunit 3 family protein [Gluconobacter kondonii]